MRFAYPEFLWAVPAFLLLATAAWFFSGSRRRGLVSRFVGDARRPWASDGAVYWRRLADFGLILVVGLMLIVALARPLLFRQDEQSELRGVPYIVALDLSRSMLATDVRPNRWAVATNALSKFLELANADRVGLITFSGVAYLNAPLSFDTGAIQAMLRYSSPYAFDMDGETAGSDLGAAIERAGRYFTSNNISPRVVILVTDGEDSGDQLLNIARRWTRQGLKVCAIGVGTRAGSKVPRINWGGSAQNSSGQEVVSRLNEANLKRVTALTGGRYYPIGDRGEGFMSLRRDFLAPMAETAAREDLKNYAEGYQLPLALAVLAMILRFAIGANRTRLSSKLPSIRQPQAAAGP